MRKLKKKTIVFSSILVLVTMVSVPAGYAKATEKNWSGVIYPGVYIEDIDVSGKKLQEAESVVREKYEAPTLSKKINIKADNKTYTVDFNKLQISYNIEKTVDAAFSYGKNESFISRYKLIKSPERKEFKLQLTYNDKFIDELLDKIEKDVKREAVPAKISVKDGQMKITPEADGRTLKKDKLKEAIINVIEGKSASTAVDIDAPVEIVKPQITADRLSAINTKVSSFSTSFKTSIANRINNIELAAKSINGTLLMPGETFSFNETVGERTRARGYKEAGVIIGDKIESGLGGGICQVSSTLYNAVLRANLNSIERRNHSLPLGYVDKGLDATVDWGNIDYKFKNTLDYPIYIEGYVENKNVYFNVYSNSKLVGKTYEMVSEVTDILEPRIKYIDNPNMNKGEEKIIKKASSGYKVKVYRKSYENGKLLKTELISSDTYNAVSGEIMRGTK